MIGTALSFIGLIVVIKFCIRNKGAIMNSKSFWASAKNLREAITKGWGKDYCHKKLDEIIENVTGELNMEKIEDNLAQHIVAHIKALKKAKEEEKLEAKAQKIIEQIQAALEE